MAKPLPKDAEWLRRSFMVPIKSATHQYDLRDILNGAAFKFTDTTPGGSFAINPPPQFTVLADRPVESLHKPKGRYGGEMGRYYSEAMDDNGTLVHMRFGVPQFNSLGNFIINAYNHDTSMQARTGRASAAFYRAGQAVGFIITLPFQPIIWAGKGYRYLTGKSSSRYYYLKPAMPMYWNAVATMVNAIGVNMGVIGRAMSEAEQTLRKEGETENFSEGDLGLYHSLLPEIFREDGGIDVKALSTRAQRLAHIHRKKMESIFESAGSYKNIADALNDYKNDTVLVDTNAMTLEESYELYHKAEANKKVLDIESNTPETDSPQIRAAGEANKTGDTFDESVSEPGFFDFAEAELQDGSAFVTFRVDDAGPVTETFSNSVEESEISSKINSMSSSTRSTRFSMADGNLGDNPVMDVAEGFISAVGNFLQGAADTVGLSAFNILAGSAFVDIPKVWSGSTANLPSASYTIELRSPYGDPMSRLINLYIPLSMLLAGALPLSTGKQSYTSPFICEMYSKGRNQTRLGMIDSLSITRGTGNLGFNRNKEPLAIDVSFSVVDLSSILHMPIESHLSLGQIAKDMMGNFDDDNAFTDYMAVLGGLSLTDQIYPTNRLRIRRARGMANWEQWKSPAHHANWLMGTTPGRLLSTMTKFTDRSG